MPAFSNQTGRHHFDAHGREVLPGGIIGMDSPVVPPEPTELRTASGPDKAEGETETKGDDSRTDKPSETKAKKG